jgi:hypothetical protein
MVIVTGFGPQLKVMMPPLATARTTAAEVQPAGDPLPMTWFGCLVLTARPAAGTVALPDGLPYRAGAGADGLGDGTGVIVAAGVGVVARAAGCPAASASVEARAALCARDTACVLLAGCGVPAWFAAVPHAVSASPAAPAASTTPKPPKDRMTPDVRPFEHDQT